MLTTIFTLDFLDNLSLLEELIVEDCPKVTTLISYESSEHDTRIFLPRLRIISLLYLPELVSISSGMHIGHNLRKLGIFCCPKLLTLSKTEVSNSLRVIIGESKWWEALKWKEAEQGEAGQSHSLNLIFSPINEEANIMTQLVAHDDEDEQQVEPENEIKGEGMKEDSPATIIFKPDMHSEETCIGNVDNLGFTFRDVNRDDSDIRSYSNKSSASIPVTQREGEILQSSNFKRFSYSDDHDTSSYGWDDHDTSSYGWDDYDVSSYSSKSSASITVTQRAGKIFQSSNLKALYSSKSSASIPVTQTEGEILESSDLKSISFSDLKTATRNFRPDNILGEGGFGMVFKGWIDEDSLVGTKPGKGMVVAVSWLNPDGLQGHDEWLAAIKYLGRLKHPNIVKLIGYCLEDEHRLLVYEFMAKGSADNHLFRRSSEPLSWSLRLKIALGAARAVAFLHNAEVQVIHRNFKTSNILLDANYNAKLSDFGLAREGPTGDRSHVTTRVMGTYGYAAPEYVATGHLSVKSDVYNFGAVFLEMLSGRRVLDVQRPSGQQNLVEWAKPYLSNKSKVFRVIDPRLEGQYSLNQAQSAATLALQCLASNPKSRPNMDEVVRVLEKLQESKDKQKSA